VGGQQNQPKIDDQNFLLEVYELTAYFANQVKDSELLNSFQQVDPC
jgi:hypothetical protein